MIISMPLYIIRGKRKPKKHYINLNNYRNWCFHLSDDIKKDYKDIVEKKVEGIKFGKMVLNFILHRGDKRRVDRANILSIHEKFFCDALTEAECIKDDCDEFLHSTHYYTGVIDKDNPRVDIEIWEMNDLIPITISVPSSAQDTSKLNAPVSIVHNQGGLA